MRLFVGIDVAKRSHQVAVVAEAGDVRVRPFSIPNSADGLAMLKARLAEVGATADFLIGMEATGTYGWAMQYHLAAHGFTVVVLNPLQTQAYSKTSIRRTKTDSIDAVAIAQLLRFGKYSPAIIPDERALRLRELTRYRHAVTSLLGRFTNLLHSRVSRIFPEFGTRFPALWLATPLGLLEKYPHPTDLVEAPAPDLAKDVRRLSKGHLDGRTSEELRTAAGRTIGLPMAKDVYSLEIRGIVSVVRMLQAHLRDITARVSTVLHERTEHLTSIPGIGDLTAAGILGEIVDIRLFDDPKKLVAFAGVDPSTFQTGDFLGNRSHISKRGSTHLRKVLYQAAFAATRFNPELRTYYERKRSQGKHHKSALIAVCRKLLHLVWRILTDDRPYETRPMPH